jgi:hypothetical protein
VISLASATDRRANVIRNMQAEGASPPRGSPGVASRCKRAAARCLLTGPALSFWGHSRPPVPLFAPSFLAAFC